MMFKGSFMKSMKFGLVAISSLGLFLTSCLPFEDGPGLLGPMYSKLGYVGLTNAGDLKVFSGIFYKLPTANFRPFTSTGIPEDTCLVTPNSSQTPPPPGTAQATLALDAGTELTVKNATETLAVLKFSAAGSSAKAKAYFNTPNPSTPDVSGAILEIPGATGGFPAMVTTLPNEIAAFTFAPKTGITKDTTFEWTSPTTDALVTFGATSGSGSSIVSVYCTVKDDGSFAFPAATKTELDAKGFTTGASLIANKGISKFVSGDDALLIVTTSRASTFVP
jgi:hypothetical protein